MHRILLVLLAAQGLSMLPAQAQDSSAVAVNTRDGSSVFKLSFSVKRVMDSSVDADNAAVAYASCSDCQTVAARLHPGGAGHGRLELADHRQRGHRHQLPVQRVRDPRRRLPVRLRRRGAGAVHRRGQPAPGRHTSPLSGAASAGRPHPPAARRRDRKAGRRVAEVVDKELVPTGQAGAPGQQAASTTTVPATSTSTISGATSTTTSGIASTTTTTAPPTTSTTVPRSTTATTAG